MLACHFSSSDYAESSSVPPRVTYVPRLNLNLNTDAKKRATEKNTTRTIVVAVTESDG